MVTPRVVALMTVEAAEWESARPLFDDGPGVLAEGPVVLAKWLTAFPVA